MGSWSWESSFWSAIAYELPGGAITDMPGCGRPLSALPHKQGIRAGWVSNRLELYRAFAA